MNSNVVDFRRNYYNVFNILKSKDAKNTTISHCIFVVKKKEILVARETSPDLLNPIPFVWDEKKCEYSCVWDKRFLLKLPKEARELEKETGNSFFVKALSRKEYEKLRSFKNKISFNRSVMYYIDNYVALSIPSVYLGNQLISVPFLRLYVYPDLKIFCKNLSTLN